MTARYRVRVGRLYLGNREAGERAKNVYVTPDRDDADVYLSKAYAEHALTHALEQRRVPFGHVVRDVGRVLLARTADEGSSG